MQTKTRKLLSSLLALAMVFGLFAAMPMTAYAAHADDVIDITGFDFGTPVNAGTYTNWSYVASVFSITGNVRIIGTNTGGNAEMQIGINNGVTATWEATFDSSTGQVVNKFGAGTLDVVSGSITATGNGRAIIVQSGALTVSGGTIRAVDGNAIDAGAQNVTVSGGTVEATGGGTAINTTGTVTVSGGTISTTTGDAINATTVTVSSGTVSATTGDAIEATTVTVSGGTVSATTGDAINANTVNLSGGTVSATTGDAIEAVNVTKTGPGTATVTSSGTAIQSSLANSNIEVTGGTLNITGAVTMTGADSYIIAEDSTLNITGVVTLSGAGSYFEAEGGTVNIIGTVSTTKNVWAWDNSVMTITGNVSTLWLGTGTNGGTLIVNGNVTLSGGIEADDGGKTYITGTVTPADADIIVDSKMLTAGTAGHYTPNTILTAPYNGYYWDAYTDTTVALASRAYVYIRKGAIPGAPPGGGNGGNTSTSNPPTPHLLPIIINNTITPVISAVTATPGANGARLSISAASYGYGQTYQWQVQQPNGTWADIPGATTSTFEYTGLTPGQSYNVRCAVRNSSGGSVFSRELTFTAEKATMIVIDPAQPAAAFPTTGVINANNVNVRPESNTKKKAIGRFNKGGKATLLGYENGYFKIEWSNAAGFAYVSGDYIDASFAKPLEGTAKSNLTAYTQMNTSSKNKAATAKKSDSLLLLAREGKWWKAQVGGMEGYIPASKVAVR